MNHFNYNGKLYKEGATVIGADNRGLRYGDGVFETMKLYKGNLLLADEHFARLWKGMQVLGFDINRHFSPEHLVAEIITLAKKNGHEKNARVRLQIMRGDGGLYDAKNHHPQYIIQTWELAEGNGNWNSNGLIAGIYPDARKSCDILANLKHNNYLPYAMAALYAKKEKWNDALLLNNKGNICDSTIANVFLIKNDMIYTPALAEGCVAGIMRQHIICELKKSGRQIIETAINPETIYEADEVFLTNSIQNIRWVQSINECRYTSTITHEIYSAIVPTIV